MMSTNRSAHVLISALGGFSLLIAVMVILSSWSAAQAGQPPAMTSRNVNQWEGMSDTPVITIGVAAGLSLPGIGWPEVNAVQLAISQTNSSGGLNVGGVTYTLAMVALDSACDPTQAVIVANALLDAGAVAVVGHSCSGASMAAEPIYSAAGVAMISPSATDPQVTQQGYTNTFRTVTHDGSSATRLASYFRGWMGLSKSAIVESWWPVTGDYFSNSFTALGGTIVGRHTVSGTSDFTVTLNAIQSEGPDVIVNFYRNPDYVTASGLFSKMAYDLGMTSVVIGWDTDSYDESVLLTYANTAGSTAAEDDYAVMKGRRSQDMPGWTDFLAAYQAADFPNEPDDPGQFGVYAFDAAGIIFAAIERAGSLNPGDIRDQIAATHDYEGVVGTYQSFDANGDPIPQWSWLERYHNGGWSILNPTRLFLPAILRNYGP